MYYISSDAKDKSEAVLFLHGWGGSTDSFKYFYDYLSKKYYMINLDFSGFGNSPEPKNPMTIYDYVGEVYALIFKLKIKKVHIICHSFGGRVALILASRYNNLIKSLVLIDSAGLKNRFSLKVWLLKKRFKLLKKMSKLRLYKREKLTKFGSSDYKNLSQVMKRTMSLVIDENLFYTLKDIHVSTLIIWGESDKITPMYMAKKLNKNIYGSRLITIPGGHFAYIENKLFVLKKIEKFLGENYG